MRAAILGGLVALLCVSVRQAEAQQNADQWMDERVSISYQNAPATEVLGALSKVMGAQQVRLPLEPLLPVTITLNNVKARTALDAVCQTAQCAWETRNGVILISHVEAPPSPTPERISISLKQVSLEGVSRAVAAALNLTLASEVTFGEDHRSNWNLENAKVSGLMRLLSDMCGCDYSIDWSTRALRVKAVPGAVPRIMPGGVRIVPRVRQ